MWPRVGRVFWCVYEEQSVCTFLIVSDNNLAVSLELS